VTRPHPSTVGALVIGCVLFVHQACGGSDAGSTTGSGSAASAGSGSGFSGTYASVDDTPLAITFKANGSVDMGGSTGGTYTIDGEKILVTVGGEKHTFIRDGNCIEEGRDIFGKLCKGGKAGEASNVSTRNVPTVPDGTWIASNADGQFKIEFKPGNKLTMTMTPPGGKPSAQEGTFIIEGDKFHATLSQATPMVLHFVNNAYESTSFGLPMKFVKQ
jgi:hypothetical protein